MILRHTFDPPDWNFPSDTQAQSLHKSAARYMQSEGSNVWEKCFFSVVFSPFLEVCGQVHSRCLVIAFVPWIRTETMLPRNKSQTVYMWLLGWSTLVISHQDSFTLKVVNRKIPHDFRTVAELNLAAMSPPGRKGLVTWSPFHWWCSHMSHRLECSSQSKLRYGWWVRSIISARLEKHKHTSV